VGKFYHGGWSGIEVDYLNVLVPSLLGQRVSCVMVSRSWNKADYCTCGILTLTVSKLCDGGWNWNEADCLDVLVASLA
jgi:hypothetical protein